MKHQNSATPENPRKVRTLFMSDFHIGYKGFDARAALDFIKSHDCKIIYLLGDIFDGWKLEKRWYWTQDYTDLLDEIVSRKKAGVKIFYTPGNHDEKTRDLLFRPIRFALSVRYGFKINDQFEHITANGQRFIALHGDQFDSMVIQRTSKFFDRLYGWFTERSILPPRQEQTIENGKIKPWSLGKAIAKNGARVLSRFNEAAVKSVMRENVDGLVYGHSHIAGIKKTRGKILVNCGSWTSSPKKAQNHTAIIEELDGHLSLEKWSMTRRDKNDPALICMDIKNIKTYYPETLHLIHIVHALWCKDDLHLIIDTINAIKNKRHTPR